MKMRCANCGAELDEREQCPQCHAKDAEITVLSPEDKRDFRGITIEQGGREASGESYQYQDARQRIYVRQFNLSSPKAGFFIKLLIGAVLIVLAMATFSAIAFFAVIGCVIWFVLRLLR
jgi:hypothetical protein